jgi:hypothetical protein
MRVVLWLLLLTVAAHAQCAGGISGCPTAATVAVTDYTVLAQPLTTSPTGFATRKATLGQIASLVGTFASGITITTPSGLGPAITITQTTTGSVTGLGNGVNNPDCGGYVGPAINCIIANWDVAANGSVYQYLYLTKINGPHATNGPGYGTAVLAGAVDFYQDAAQGNSAYVPLTGITRILADPKAQFYATALNTNLTDVPGFVYKPGTQVVGVEFDNTTMSPGMGGRAVIKIVVADQSTPPPPAPLLNVQGSTFDALIYMGTPPNYTQFGYKNGLLFDGTWGRILATNGCIICTTVTAGQVGVPIVVDSFLRFDGWSATSWIMNAGPFTVDGTGKMTLSLNTAPVPGTLPAGDAIVHVVGKDTSAPRVLIDSFGSPVPSALNFRHADGTAAAPASPGANDPIGNTNAFAWDTSDWVLAAQYVFSSENAWSPTDHSSHWTVTTIPQGSAGPPISRFRVFASGGLSISGTTPGPLGTFFDPGTGNLHLGGLPTAPVNGTSATPYLCVDAMDVTYKKAAPGCP